MRAEAELRAICLAATKGPWSYLQDGSPHDVKILADDERVFIAGNCSDDDAAHIAAFSPDRCLLMLDVVAAARDVLAGVGIEHDDARISWVSAQVERQDLIDLRDALAALDALA